ncbi:MAG: thioredoxin domain-containing protein [Candidatus Peribacteraceae bacterium]|nr:thioredoxin domain-containing protein [Candidatus Peribacteraceae bacterium]MDD5075121.1 thioredoxin domain-containing protein [Candidatus Peribacteraceae bacterium]
MKLPPPPRTFSLLLLTLLTAWPLASHAADITGNTTLNLPLIDWKTEHALGRRTAPVLAILYSDYQCPFCRIEQARMRSFYRKNRNRIAWIFRHYPLAFHDKAMPAAEAAECAGSLNGNTAFWQFTDAIFEGNGNFDFPSIAKRIGINVSALQKCMDDHAMTVHIEAERDEGVTAGVTGTPTLFLLNKKTGRGEMIIGAQEQSVLQKTLDKLLLK